MPLPLGGLVRRGGGPLLVVLPNVSASAAEALEQVPVLGPLVQVVTLRNYLYDDGHSFANVSVPQVQEGGQAGLSLIHI